jgi:hypothetical protein
MSVVIQFENAAGELDAILLTQLRSGAEDSATLTEHAIGSEGAVNDSLIQNSTPLTIEVVESDTPVEVPLGATGGVRNLSLNVANTFREPSKASGANGVTLSEPEAVQVARGASALAFDEEFSRARTVYEQLLAFKEGAAQLTVTTALRVYPQMILTLISQERGPQEAKAFKGSLTFTSFKIAASEVIDSPQPLETRGQRNRRRGRQPAEEASEEEAARLRSIARGGLGALLGES